MLRRNITFGRPRNLPYLGRNFPLKSMTRADGFVREAVLLQHDALRVFFSA